jgi:hypothetical protein
MKRNQALLQDLAAQLPGGAVSDRIHQVLTENRKLLGQWSVTTVHNESFGKKRS